MHIHISLETTNPTIKPDVVIELPRLQLRFDFDMAKHRISSRQYQGMEIDPDQRIGTLIGLRSKLVLKGAKGRTLLIPEGAFTYARESNSDHIEVTVEENSASRIRAYEIDNILGRIIGDSSIQGKLLLTYLLGLTTACLPNPLSQTTGTEAALNILRSAALRSFETLTEDNVSLLTLIGGLSTTHATISDNEYVLQQVVWDEQLSPLAQHPQFRCLVEQIFSQARDMELFYPDRFVPPENEALGWKLTEAPLTKRNALRTSAFRVCGYGAEDFTTHHDVLYHGRDQNSASERGRKAFVAATMIIRRQPALHAAIPDLKNAMLGTHFQQATIKGVSCASDAPNLRYDAGWLGHSTTILTHHWSNLHATLSNRNGKGESKKFAIMVWLATFAYASSADMLSIQVLAAMYRLTDIAKVQLPQHSAFELAEGYKWISKDIEASLRLAEKAITLCPEGIIPRIDSETTVQHAERTHNLFAPKQKAAFTKFVAFLERQWPCDEPLAPQALEIVTYFHVDLAMTKIKKLFKTWNANLNFMQYLEDMTSAIAKQKVVPVLAPCYVSSSPARPEYKNHPTISYYSGGNIFTALAPTWGGRNDPAPTEPAFPTIEESSRSGQRRMQDDLKQLCRHLDFLAKSSREKSYVKDLRNSCAALSTFGKGVRVPAISESVQIEALIRKYIEDCCDYFDHLNDVLMHIVTGKSGSSYNMAARLGLAPRISPTFWLSYLLRERFSQLNDDWKATIVQYGLAITYLNRAIKLVALLEKPAELAEEFRYVGHLNWDPHEWPETLLLEAESGIMIREAQESIAKQMRSPENNANTVMQLNMGEGKSSVVSAHSHCSFEYVANCW